MFACKNSREQEEWMSALVDAGIDLLSESLGEYDGKTIFDFTCKDIDGNENDLSLSNFKGNFCLIVNVASK